MKTHFIYIWIFKIQTGCRISHNLPFCVPVNNKECPLPFKLKTSTRRVNPSQAGLTPWDTGVSCYCGRSNECNRVMSVVSPSQFTLLKAGPCTSAHLAHRLGGWGGGVTKHKAVILIPSSVTVTCGDLCWGTLVVKRVGRGFSRALCLGLSQTVKAPTSPFPVSICHLPFPHIQKLLVTQTATTLQRWLQCTALYLNES